MSYFNVGQFNPSSGVLWLVLQVTNQVPKLRGVDIDLFNLRENHPKTLPPRVVDHAWLRQRAGPGPGG